MLHGIPVNPAGAACLRFVARSASRSLILRSTKQLSPPKRNEKMEVDLSDLKRRLDAIESKIKQMKIMLKH